MISNKPQHPPQLLLPPGLPDLCPSPSHAPSETARSGKFIPQQFRNKHLNDSPEKKSFLPKPHKKSLQLLTTPFKKKLTLQDYKNTPESSSQKLIQQNHRNEVSRNQKRIKHFENAASFPKLRETNSTMCQSPKAGTGSQHSRFREFRVLRKLGMGRFGEVFLVKHLKTGFVAAMKVINKQSLISTTQQETDKSINQLVSEIKIQSFLNHPNIIAIYDCFSDERNVYLLIELATDGHLFAFTSQGRAFSEEATSILVREIAEGVREMHKRSIIHRDIKLQNIVLSMGMAKICDFGWSAYCPKQFRTTLCGTPLYLSPQMLIGKAYNKKVDIWAIGSITHELATSKDPFQIKNSDDLSKIITDDFQMLLGSPQLRSFVGFVLKKNPSKRPDAETLLKHPFIQKYRDLQTSQQLSRVHC